MSLIGRLTSGTRLYRTLFVACVSMASASAIGASDQTFIPLLWDTCASPGTEVNVQDRSGWKMVPSDLMMLEADPPKSRSDPGFYGREYSFKGDAVVENEKLMAVFLLAKGRVVIYAKTPSLGAKEPTAGAGPKVSKVFELTPQVESTPSGRGNIEILRNAEDEVVLRFLFGGSPVVSAVLGFGKAEIIDVKPSAGMKGARVSGSFECGIVP